MESVPSIRQTLGDLSHSRQNHFDLLRLLLSLAVLYSHSYVLSGQTEDAITLLTGHQIAASTFALFGFFVISGYLIAGSWDRSRSWTDFAVRRARRIVPGFVLAVLFSFFVVGPLGATSISNYFRDPSAWNFLTLLCMKVPQGISSTFVSNPDACMLNGSLWTIRLEITCYVLAALVGAAGLLRKPVFALCLALTTAIIWIAFHSRSQDSMHISFYLWGMIQMTVPFAIGMSSYVCRDSITASKWLLLLSVAVLAVTAVVGGMVYAVWVCGAYALIFVGLLPGEPALTRWTGDLSYGVYLYAFPVQQIVVNWMHNPGPLALMAISIPSTLGLAWLSWNFIESPFLHRQKPRYSLQTKSNFADVGLVPTVE